jgi:hypothetical protein
MQWGRRDPAPYGSKPSREAMPAFRRCEPTFGPAEWTDGDPVCLRDPTPEHSVHLALASLVLGSREPLLASLKSVAAVLRFRSGDQRLISRDAKPKPAFGIVFIGFAGGPIGFSGTIG